jgi:hypothetical protein
VPSSPIAAGQHAALLIIDTACHGLRAVTGAIDCFAGGGALIRLFHMNRLSIHGDRIVPAVNVLITFMRGRSTGNTWETHLNERFPLLICPKPAFRHRTENLPIDGRGHRVRQTERVQPGALSPRGKGVEG